MSFDAKKVKGDARKNWQRAWIDSAKLIPEKSKTDFSGGEGSVHPIHELVQQVRKVFVELGFREVENPVFIGEEEVYKQYGPEAPVILDRVYYLAGLPRPDIGLSDEKILKTKEIVELDVEKLKKIFRDYRAGGIEGDDLLEEMTRRLGIETQQASAILELFPEFKQLEPQASKLTLRSHMTGAWFPTLSALASEPLPQKLFSVGLRFRREQKVDATHLRAHYGGSMVVAGEDVSLAAGRKLTEKILERLGFTDIKFEKKKATSNYYAPDTEYEVFSKGIEIADIGMYSPVALAQYDIPFHAFNLGFGLERMIMVKTGAKDVRELLYPQFYANLELSDKEILAQVEVAESPASKEGVKLASAIKKAAMKNAAEKSPAAFKAFEGEIAGKKVEVSIVEKEEGTQLLGPAALNDIYVHDGAVYGIPKDASKLKGNVDEIKKKGLKAGFGFVDALADYFAAQVERKVAAGETEGLIQVKMIKSPAEANILVGDKARRFIESQNKSIMLKGPVFTAAEFKVLK